MFVKNKEKSLNIKMEFVPVEVIFMGNAKRNIDINCNAFDVMSTIHGVCDAILDLKDNTRFTVTSQIGAIMCSIHCNKNGSVCIEISDIEEECFYVPKDIIVING